MGAPAEWFNDTGSSAVWAVVRRELYEVLRSSQNMEAKPLHHMMGLNRVNGSVGRIAIPELQM
jgi:hypothetical protein